jgi:hypothetical protein
LLSYFNETVFTSSDENQINTVPRQLDHQRPTNAARRASDECAPIGKWSMGHAVL